MLRRHSFRVPIGIPTAALLAAAVTVAVKPSPEAGVGEILAASCSSVFGAKEPPACEVSDRLGEPGELRAEVNWTTQEGALRAEITVFSVEGELHASRELFFDRQSRAEERWEAIGLVVAALVNAELSSRPQEPAPPSPAPAPIPTPELASEREQHANTRSHLVLNLAGAFQGSNADYISFGGAFRAGLDLGLALRPTLGVQVLVGTTPTDHLSVRPRLGLEWWVSQERLAWGFYGEGMLAVTQWSAEMSGQKESSSSLRYGGALGAQFAIPLVPWFGAQLRGGATFLTPSIEVLVEDQRLGLIKALGGEAELGFWLRF